MLAGSLANTAPPGPGQEESWGLVRLLYGGGGEPGRGDGDGGQEGRAGGLVAGLCVQGRLGQGGAVLGVEPEAGDLLTGGGQGGGGEEEEGEQVTEQGRGQEGQEGGQPGGRPGLGEAEGRGRGEGGG